MAHNFPRDQNQTRRGGRYDHRHQQARAAAARHHQPTDPCTRCGHELGPMGRWLHYDHNDDGTGYLGFAHGAPCPHCGIRCNTRAGAVEGNSRSRGTTSQHRRSSRTW